MPSEIAEHMIYGETHNIACETCGTHEGVMYRCFTSGGGAHLCKDCMIRHETEECIPALFCCIGVPMLIGITFALTVLGVPSEVFPVIIIAALAIVVLLLWKISRRISESYWKG